MVFIPDFFIYICSKGINEIVAVIVVPFPELSCYTHEEILYHIRQCKESGLITEVHYYDGGKHTDISDLTPTGHEFLANIRNDSIWKKVISKGSGASLSILMELAKQTALKYFLG